MKNVNIITIHKEPNYGAILQAYALYHIIEKSGHRAHIIDLSMMYRFHPFNPLNRILIPLHNWLKGYDRCYRIAADFSERHEPERIGPFSTVAQLEKYNWNKDDIYIVGSDQVWNPALTGLLARAFTLSFLPESCNGKYAYASSFGNIKDEKQRAEDLDLKSTIGSFRKIAVREKFGVEFLKKNGISSIEVIDPTLLLDDYSFLLPSAPADSGNLLYLSLGHAPVMDAFADDIAKKINLPLEKRFGYLQPQKEVNRQWLKVEEWLHRIACSRVVVTDSFHATVFAIMFRRPFYVFISEPSKAFRITNLLEKLGLGDRIVASVDDAEKVTEIDYDDVAAKLAVYRAESLNYLNEILN